MSSLSDHDCLALLQMHPRAHAEAQRAFAVLFERYQRRLQCHLRAEYQWLREADLAEACQETWLRAWRALNDSIPAEKFRAWLYRIGSNLVIDMLRGKDRHKEVALPDSELSSAQAAHTHQLAFAEQLQSCLERLPQTHRELTSRLMDLQSYDEIAEQIRIPKTRLYQLKLEAGRMLTNCMEKA
jgi:RNA polymerase sigma factor (sigma-70 family)